MLGQFSRQEKADSSLNLPRGDGGPGKKTINIWFTNHTTTPPLVVVGQLARLGSNPLEEVVNERVHDRHGFGRHPSVRMHLL
jgi:hypothetical protein